MIFVEKRMHSYYISPILQFTGPLQMLTIALDIKMGPSRESG